MGTHAGIAAASGKVANSIIEESKGTVENTVRISKEDMIEKIDSLFLENVPEEYLVSVKKLFSPWQKGASINSIDEKYELKTFIMGAFSKWLNLRASRIWIYEKETNTCYECKAWSLKKVVKYVKNK
jgi:hypothetical protein